MRRRNCRRTAYHRRGQDSKRLSASVRFLHSALELGNRELLHLLARRVGRRDNNHFSSRSGMNGSDTHLRANLSELEQYIA